MIFSVFEIKISLSLLFPANIHTLIKGHPNLNDWIIWFWCQQAYEYSDYLGGITINFIDIL